MAILVFIARVLLAIAFIVSGLAKLVDPKGTRQSLIDFQLATGLASTLSFALPFTEFVISIALVPTRSGVWGGLAALMFLFVVTSAVGVTLVGGRRPPCHCFGQLDSTPIGWKTLLRNAAFAGIAAFITWQGWTMSLSAGATSKTWPVNAQVQVAALIGVILAGTVLTGGGLIFRLQQRLASLESSLSRVGFTLSPGASTLTAGLAAGTRAPGFRLPGQDGKTITLDSLRSAGKPIVLVFTDTQCGPCKLLLPTLGRWQSDYAAHLAIVNIRSGTLASNQAKGAAHDVQNVLQSTGGEVVQAYRVPVLPSAVLIRVDGTIGDALAVGEGAIGSLIQNAAHGRHGEQTWSSGK
jgi:peroxiredoxin